jgi:hypothetical protein
VTLPDGTGRDNGWLGIVPPPAAPTSLLDLFASVPFGTRKAEFLRREGGVAEAEIQVEGAVKQQAQITYLDAEAEAVTIASWVKVKRQQVDDIDGLLPDLRIALNQGVMVRVEELLIGSPTATGAPDGITESTGVLAPTVTATNLSDAVGAVKAQLAVTGVSANFVAAHPLDIEEEEARTGTDGHPVGAIDDQGRIRRLPLVPSIALAPGKVLMGDSRIGARLGVRSPVSVVVGQESDDMVRNKVTVLAEGRWAPVVLVPAAFAYFTLP